MSYDFAYSVRDDETGAAFGHMEQRTGNTTHGEYRVSLPDGRVQVVSYVADEQGYQAKVSYEPASPSQDVYSALKYAPRPSRYRQFAPRVYRRRQRRPKIYKHPHTRLSNMQHGSDHSFISEPSSYISAEKDASRTFETSHSKPHLSEMNDAASYPPLSKIDFHHPEPLSSYPPNGRPHAILPLRKAVRPHASYSPTPIKGLDISKLSSSSFAQPTNESNLHNHSLSFTSEPEIPYSSDSTTPSHYLRVKNSSYEIDSLTFPGPPVIGRLVNEVLETKQHPSDSPPYRNTTLRATTYRPRHQNPARFSSLSSLAKENSSSHFFKTNNTSKSLSTPSLNTTSPTRSSVSYLPPSSYPLSPQNSKSHSPQPSTAPPYYISIPVPYTRAPSYSESSPVPHSPPKPPYFGPQYREYFSGPSYPPQITGLPSRLSTIRPPFSTPTPLL